MGVTPVHPAAPAASVGAPARPAELLRRVNGVRARVAAARRGGARIALVPTMGALHDGHLALIDRARDLADVAVVSVFVNPLQFGAGEDLDRYPRDLEGDLRLASSRGADLLFAPSAAEMYPAGEPEVMVVPGAMAEGLCGASRPGHFRGVLTVVAKLFAVVAPDVAVFGQKDFQQVRLVRRMAKDLNFPVHVETIPTVRESDGLALSSRNRYLAPEHRAAALGLIGALRHAQERFLAGERDGDALRGAMRAALARAGAEVEYAEVVNADTLRPLARAEAGAACLVAARVAGTRLIDTLLLRAPDPDQPAG